MAIVTVQGVVYAERNTNPNATNWLTPGYVDGRKKVMLDFYVGLGTESAGSKILMGGAITPGAKITSIVVHVSASTGGLTVSVGDLALATRYVTSATGPATGPSTTGFTGCIDATNGFYTIGTNPGTGPNAALLGDAQIQLTTGGATLGAGTIYGVEVNYTTD